MGPVRRVALDEGDLIRGMSLFWRRARLDAPCQIVFRRAYEELANRPGERGGGRKPGCRERLLSRAPVLYGRVKAHLDKLATQRKKLATWHCRIMARVAMSGWARHPVRHYGRPVKA